MKRQILNCHSHLLFGRKGDEYKSNVVTLFFIVGGFDLIMKTYNIFYFIKRKIEEGEKIDSSQLDGAPSRLNALVEIAPVEKSYYVNKRNTKNILLNRYRVNLLSYGSVYIVVTCGRQLENRLSK